MKGLRLCLLICFFCILCSRISAQQNIQFTQYVFNSLSINPAYAGYKEEWFAQLALRAQWVGVEGAPQTASASLDGILDPRDRRMGLGVQISSDKVGPQSAASATVNYAYRLQLDPDDTKRLSFGLGIGVAQYSIKGDLLDTYDPDDIAVPAGNASNLVPDFRLGIFYNTDFWYLGVSVLDAFSNSKTNQTIRNSSSMNIIRSRHAYLMGGTLINVNPDFRIRPSVLIKDDFKGPTSMDFNVMTIFSDKLWLGASYRTGFNLRKTIDESNNMGKQNSISGVVQVFVSERFRIGYSYDHVTSQLGSARNGSHEITMGLTFGRVPRSMICPRVF